MLAGIAAAETSRFTGRNLRVRRSHVVHAVRMATWFAGLQMPAPACGQAWYGAGLGELNPAAEAVNCHHCLTSAAARAAAIDAPDGQIPLPLQLN